MTGKVGYSYKGEQYRTYYCSRSGKSRGLCAVSNGHSAAKLGKAILEYLGEFSNPIKVRQYLAAAEKQDTEKYEVELKRVEKRLVDLDIQFLTQLDGLLKRKVLNEQEFVKAKETARSQKADLEARREELTHLLGKVKATENIVERVPRVIKPLRKPFIAWNLVSRKHNCGRS
jgi:hypothetical protein